MPGSRRADGREPSACHREDAGCGTTVQGRRSPGRAWDAPAASSTNPHDEIEHQLLELLHTPSRRMVGEDARARASPYFPPGTLIQAQVAEHVVGALCKQDLGSRFE